MIRRVCFAAYCLFILGLSLVQLPEQASRWSRQDLIAHFFVYGILAVMAFWMLSDGNQVPRAGISKRRYLIAFAFTVVYGLLNEALQGFVPARQMSFADLAADALGGAAALGVIKLRT